MREKLRYHLTCLSLIALTCSYLTLALGRELRPGREEIFPFASWSLFSLVPNETKDYSLLIEEVDGRRLEKPVYFEHSAEWFESARLNSARMTIQRLGRALDRHDTRWANEERANVERIHLCHHGRVKYQVVARTYDALKRWREGAINSQRVVATFEVPGEAMAVNAR